MHEEMIANDQSLIVRISIQTLKRDLKFLKALKFILKTEDLHLELMNI